VKAPAPPTRLKPWRYLRALVASFLVLKFAGWAPLTDAPARSVAAVAIWAIAFFLWLRFERWIQTKREEAERGPSDP